MGNRSISSAIVGIALICCTHLSSASAHEEEREQSINRTIASLKQQAKAGVVRVIVQVRVEPDSFHGADAESRLAAIGRAQDRLVNAMRDSKLDVIERLQGRPMLVMELNGVQLDKLVETGLVENIYSDGLSRPK